MGQREAELTDTAWSGAEMLGNPQQRTWVLVVRILAVIAVVVGWALHYQTPAHRSVDDFYAALDAGAVTQVTVERPDFSGLGFGSFQVEWEGRGRPGQALYRYSTETGARVDEGAEIIRAAERSGVDVDIVGEVMSTGFTWSPHGTGAFVALVLLVGGTAPRLATRWAWFWLWYCVPFTALLYLLLEPVPLWRRGAPPARRRLTGGWAFLLAILLENSLPQLFPLYADLVAP